MIIWRFKIRNGLISTLRVKDIGHKVTIIDLKDTRLGLYYDTLKIVIININLLIFKKWPMYNILLLILDPILNIFYTLVKPLLMVINYYT